MVITIFTNIVWTLPKRIQVSWILKFWRILIFWKFLTIYIIDYHAVQRTNLPTYTIFIVQKYHKSSLTTDSLQKVGISNSLKPFMVYYSYYTLFFSIFKLSRPRTLNCIGQECQSFIVCFPEFFPYLEKMYAKNTVGPPVENTPKIKFGQLLFGRHTELEKPEIEVILSRNRQCITISDLKSFDTAYGHYILVCVSCILHCNTKDCLQMSKNVTRHL